MLAPERTASSASSAQRSQTGFDAFLAPGHRVADVEFERAELAAGVFLDVTQLLHVGEGQHRLRNFQTDRRVDVVETFSRFGFGPTKDTSDMTSSSRIGSIGGLVTCANSCLK
jgi:hypothetical protein